MLVTLVCIVSIVAFPLSTFSATFAFTTGLASLGAAVAMIMSARHEEQIHQLAARLDRSEAFEPILEGGQEDADAPTTSNDETRGPTDETDGHL